MLFWSWPCGLFSLWSGPRQKRIFLMGINKPFINILCCAHLPVCLTSILLFLFIPSLFFQAYYFWYPYSFLLLSSSAFFPVFSLFFLQASPSCPTPTQLYSAYPAASALKERPAERRRMSQHLRVGFNSTSISTCFSSFFPVQYTTDHNSWPVSLLKLQSAVT